MIDLSVAEQRVTPGAEFAAGVSEKVTVLTVADGRVTFRSSRPELPAMSLPFLRFCMLVSDIEDAASMQNL